MSDIKNCRCEGEIFWLKKELPHDLNVGDEVTLSQDGYIIKCASRDTKHLLEEFPYHLKKHEGYLVTCNRLESIGFFKGYYFINKRVNHKNVLKKNIEVHDKWEANTKSPKGFIPMCIVATKEYCRYTVSWNYGDCCLYMHHTKNGGSN